jgi:hypothetical protein
MSPSLSTLRRKRDFVWRWNRLSFAEVVCLSAHTLRLLTTLRVSRKLGICNILAKLVPHSPSYRNQHSAHSDRPQEHRQYKSTRRNLREKHTHWHTSTGTGKRGTPTKRRKHTHIYIYEYIYTFSTNPILILIPILTSPKTLIF